MLWCRKKLEKLISDRQDSRACILNFSGSREFVYSDFQGLDRFLVSSVYRTLEKPGSGELVYSIFKTRAGSWSIAYTVYAKSLGPGQILGRWRIQDARKAQIRGACILNFSRPGQAPGRWRIQYTQKVRTRAGSWSMAYTGCSKGQNPDSSQGNLYTQKS